MNESDMLGRLRDLGKDGPTPAWSGRDLVPAGRRLRRRRAAVAGGGVASVAGGVLAAALLLGSAPPTDVVVSPASGGGGASAGEEPASKRKAPRSVQDLARDASARNAAILQDALGDDWEIDSDTPAGTVRKGSVAEGKLPDGMDVSVRMSAMEATAATLAEFCRRTLEKGTITRACTEHTLPDGTVLQEQTSYWGPIPDRPQETSGQGLRMLYRQDSGVLVFADLYVGGPAEDPTTQRQRAARDWVDQWADALGAAVSDPDVLPEGFVQDDADPDRAASDRRLVAKAGDFCPDGVDHEVKPDFAWLSEPPTEPDGAFREWVAREGGNDAIERARIASKNRNVQRYGYVRRDKQGRAGSIVEVSAISNGKYYTITTVYYCN